MFPILLLLVGFLAYVKGFFKSQAFVYFSLVMIALFLFQLLIIDNL